MDRVSLRPFFLSCLQSREQLVLENAFLRYQLQVIRKRRKRVELRPVQRQILSWFCRRIEKWRESLFLVTPETIVRWHRTKFGMFWSGVAHNKRGRPSISPRTIELIQRISRENFLWGAPRIRSELLKLGIDVSEASIDKYRIKRRRPPSQSWKTFLKNHSADVVAVDFFTVPTLAMKVLYALVVLSHDRRRLLHVAVTPRPTEEWTSQQVREAFPFAEMPKYLVHDGGRSFSKLSHLGIECIRTSPGCPWQNGYVERIIGSIRRECLDHVVVVNERHLERLLASYRDYYNRARPHLALERDSPEGRSVQRDGEVIVTAEVGGLHHRYERRVA